MCIQKLAWHFHLDISKVSQKQMCPQKFYSNYDPFPVFTISVNGTHFSLIAEGRNSALPPITSKQTSVDFKPSLSVVNTIVHATSIIYNLVSYPLHPLSKCSSQPIWVPTTDGTVFKTHPHFSVPNIFVFLLNTSYSQMYTSSCYLRALVLSLAFIYYFKKFIYLVVSGLGFIWGAPA